MVSGLADTGKIKLDMKTAKCVRGMAGNVTEEAVLAALESGKGKKEAGHVCVGGVFKFAFIFAGQEGVYDFTLGFCEVGVLVALVGLAVFEEGCLVVCVLCEKGVEGVVFEAVHT